MGDTLSPMHSPTPSRIVVLSFVREHGPSPDDLIQHGGRHRPDQRDKIEAVDRCWTMMTGQPYSCAALYHVEATECSRRPFVTCWASRCRSFSLPWAAARRRNSLPP